MSALPPKADIRPRDQDVCFGPSADLKTGSLNPIETDALFQVRWLLKSGLQTPFDSPGIFVVAADRIVRQPRSSKP
jgi:hypothetical protein